MIVLPSVVQKLSLREPLEDFFATLSSASVAARSSARFCNRYVSDFPDVLGAGNVIAGAASTDLGDALLQLDAYKAGEVTVQSVEGTVEIRRGQRQAFLRKVKLARSVPKGTRKVRATETT